MIRRYLTRKFHTELLKIESRKYIAQWFIQFGWPEDPLQPDLAAMHTILPPTDRFFADPFVACVDGRYFIFLEEFLFGKPPGYISVVEVFRDGTHGEVTPIIRESYHLSYPWIINQHGQWFMIPETCKNGTVEWWVCEEFPYRWKKGGQLMENLLAADTTPFFHLDCWWLFSALKQDCKKFGNKLFLFSGEDLFGRDWTPHPMNPVKVGLVHDRPAGNIIRDGERLLRPAQDSMKRYGGALELREITAFTETTYTEKLWKRVDPNWCTEVKGVHTWNCEQGLLVIDALRLLPKYPLLAETPGQNNV